MYDTPGANLTLAAPGQIFYVCQFVMGTPEMQRVLSSKINSIALKKCIVFMATVNMILEQWVYLQI